MKIAQSVTHALGDTPPFRIEAFDGSSGGSPDSPLTVRFVRPEALQRMLARPGELGLARAYVAGDIELDGPLDPLFALEMPPITRVLTPGLVVRLLKDVGSEVFSPPPPPSIEARPSGALHSRGRDREAVSHHYDVSNAFYEMVLGPSMTYSCAVFEHEGDSLEDAQERKVDLICQKLNLGPGSRLLDVGCGWGALGIHAARHYGATVVGVTLAEEQQHYAARWAERAGVGDQAEFRVEDFRDVADGPFDAISSVGMFEHVGRRSMEQYLESLWELLRPGGRLLHHAIGRPPQRPNGGSTSRRNEFIRRVKVAGGFRGPSKVHSAFIDRYVFPDGELHEVGDVTSMLQVHGFEVRHLESLREHYALTLRRWVANLEASFDEAVAEVGAERARVWRLYMAGSAVGFETNHLQVHQTLCVRPDQGQSSMALRPRWATAPSSRDDVRGR